MPVTTDTTTVVKNRLIKRDIGLKKSVLAISILASFSVSAAELTYRADVNASYINIGSDTGASEENASDTFSVQPSLGLNFQSKRITSAVTASHRYLDRHISTTSEELRDSSSSNFTNYTATANINVIDNVLQLNARGSQSYQNVDIATTIINDEVFGSQQLAKTKRETLGATFTLPNPDWFALSVSGNTSSVTTDRAREGAVAVDSENNSVQASITQGDEVKRVSWNIQGSYREANGTGRNDITSERVNANFYVGVADEIRLVATAQQDNNELSSEDVAGTRNIDFESYGLGVSWFKNASRFIDVTYNTSKEADGSTDNFVGLNFAWRFTARTSVSGSYGKRSFGRTGQFSFAHQVRKFRTSVSYQEDLTTFSTLLLGEEAQATFVCPLESEDLTGCFLPDTIDYQLQAGERFEDFSFFLPEVSEEAILRKSLAITNGYQFRKIRISTTLRNTQTEFQDTLRKQDNLNLNVAVSAKLGRKSTVTWTNSYSNLDSRLLDGGSDKVLSWRSSLNYSYRIGRNLTTRVGLQYSKNNSAFENQDFYSRRLTLSINYRIK